PERRGGGLPARQPIREAAQADGRVGRVLRQGRDGCGQGGCARSCANTAIASPKARGRPASRRTSSTVDVLALRHLSPETVMTVAPMAKKTTADYLARLPQFEPRPVPFADLQEYDVQVQREQGIDVQVQEEQGNTPWLGKMPKPLRCERIDDVLS